MIHLRSIQIKPSENPPSEYPFQLPLVKNNPLITFNSPVTFFVGENGSGKSTLLEAIAAAIGSIIIGSESIQQDKSLQPARNLAFHMQLVWNKRTKKGFFLRAEDFFGYAKRMAAMKAELQADLNEMEHQTKDRSVYAQQLAEQAFQREIHGMEQNNSDMLEQISHGESFIQLVQSRFVPGGL